MIAQGFSSGLVLGCKNFLGEKGMAFFREMMEKHGEVSPVYGDPLYSEEEVAAGKKQMIIPHPVHFREGMQVRNWMRGHSDTNGWSDIDYDDRWVPLVQKVLSEY